MKAIPQSPPPAPDGLPAPPYCSARSHNLANNGVSISVLLAFPTAAKECLFFFTPSNKRGRSPSCIPWEKAATAASLSVRNCGNDAGFFSFTFRTLSPSLAVEAGFPVHPIQICISSGNRIGFIEKSGQSFSNSSVNLLAFSYDVFNQFAWNEPYYNLPP